MVNEPPTGIIFHSNLGTPEMAERLRDRLPEYDWCLGDSDLYSYYYVRGKRMDGLEIKILPEDGPAEYYLGVYFAGMTAYPERAQKLAMAQQIHKQMLPIVEGVCRI